MIQQPQNPFCPSRRGASLLELIVVVSVIAILLALILPAVQSARDAARAARCLSNLRLLAAAVIHYHGDHGMTPGWALSGRPDHSYASIHSHLLPYLDRADLYDELNHLLRVPQPHSAPASSWVPFTTVAQRTVSTFVCPADTAGAMAAPGRTNYRGNWGVGPYWSQDAEFPDSANGFFGGLPPFSRRFAHVFDGLSKTLMFAERTTGTFLPTLSDRQRDIYGMPKGHWDRFKTADGCAEMCLASSAGVAQSLAFTDAGRYWLVTGVHHTLYTHVLPPNSPIPDCQSLAAHPPTGSAAARSQHGGGVQVAFGDGSARFVAQGIDLGVWRAMGSRNGGEVSPGPPGL